MPGDACFGPWNDETEGVGVCAESPCSPCSTSQLNAHDAQLILAVEASQEPHVRALDVWLLSVRRFSDVCVCTSAADCAASEAQVCSVRDLAPADRLPATNCPAEEETCAGLCVSDTWTPCEPWVGRFADGERATTARFRETYRSYSPQIGCPVVCTAGDDDCTPFVHDRWGVLLQDFYQPQPGLRRADSSDGLSALASAASGGPVFLLSGAFWGIYKCLRIVDPATGESGVAGPRLLGPPLGPTSNMDGPIFQDFSGGRIVFDGAVQHAQIYLDQSDIAQVDPDCHLNFTWDILARTGMPL